MLVRAADLTADGDAASLRTPQSLQDYWIEINRLENEADQLHRRLLATLFSGMYEPMEVLKLKDVVEELEAAADAFEHVAHAVADDRRQGSVSVETAVIVVIVVLVAFAFDYTNGFHDAANAIATAVSTRALTPRVALAARGRHELRSAPSSARRSRRP